MADFTRNYSMLPYYARDFIRYQSSFASARTLDVYAVYICSYLIFTGTRETASEWQKHRYGPDGRSATSFIRYVSSTFGKHKGHTAAKVLRAWCRYLAREDVTCL